MFIYSTNKIFSFAHFPKIIIISIVGFPYIEILRTILYILLIKSKNLSFHRALMFISCCLHKTPECQFHKRYWMVPIHKQPKYVLICNFVHNICPYISIILPQVSYNVCIVPKNDWLFDFHGFCFPQKWRNTVFCITQHYLKRLYIVFIKSYEQI